METITTPGAMQAWSDARRAAGERIALVPTMGALHAGHVALIEEAKRRADKVAATIFVNPTQFGPNEDFARYPRREEQDADALEAAGCDLLWTPGVEDIYPDGPVADVHAGPVSRRKVRTVSG